MSDCSLSSLPFWRWPAFAYAHEPAHGFFVRIAELNEAPSVGAYAHQVGLSSEPFDLDEMLALFGRLGLDTFHHLQRSTPLTYADGSIALNGVKLGPRCFSLQQPRVCDACLGEEVYYRNWWDVSIIARCPIHDRPLISEKNGSKLSWRIPHVGVTRRGEFVGVRGVAPPDHPREAWDSYLLGRLRITQPLSIPTLDSMDLKDVVQIVGIVGRAAAHGWSKKRPKSASHDSDQRRAELGRGFLILKNGEEGLLELLTAYTRHSPQSPSCDEPTFATDSFYGWLNNAVVTLPMGPARNFIGRTMRAFAAERGIYSRKAPHPVGLTRDELFEGPMTLKTLASYLQITPSKLREVLGKLSLGRTIGDRTRNYSFSPETVNLIQDTLQSLIFRNEAASMLGISLKEFKEICLAAGIKPFIRLGGATSAHDKFDHRQIEELLAKTRSKTTSGHGEVGMLLNHYAKATRTTISNIVSRINSGEIELIGWNEAEKGYRGAILPTPPVKATFQRRKVRQLPGITNFAAATKLGVQPEVVKALVKAEHLRLVSKSSRRIDSQSFDNFQSTFASARSYAGLLNCHRSKAYARLISAGISHIRIYFGNSRAYFVPRAEARNVLGLERDPDWCAGSAEDEFWNGLNNYLESNRSPIRALREKDSHLAKLTSSDRKSTSTVSLDPIRNRLVLEVACNGHSSNRQFGILQQRASLLHRDWPEAAIRVDPGNRKIQVIEFQTCSLRFPEEWLPAYRWLGDRMTRLRGLLRQPLAQLAGQSPPLAPLSPAVHIAA